MDSYDKEGKCIGIFGEGRRMQISSSLSHTYLRRRVQWRLIVGSHEMGRLSKGCARQDGKGWCRYVVSMVLDEKEKFEIKNAADVDDVDDR